MPSTTNPIDSSVLVVSKRKTIQNTLERRDPISIEIKDSRKMISFFKKYPLYPYSGNSQSSANSLLNFFIRLAKLSPTDGSCIKSICDYVIGDGVVVQKIDDEFIDLEDSAEVPANIKVEFKKMIRSGRIADGNLMTMGKKLLKNFKITGDYFLKLDLIETLGVKTFELKVIDNEDIKYLTDENRNPIDMFAISPVWEDKYLTDNPPTIIHKYPMFSDFGNGVRSTIFHTQNGGNKHGRPDSIEATLSKYAEFQNLDYRLKQTDNAWAGDLIIEMGQGDPENNTAIAKDVLTADSYEKNFTNNSENPLSAFITERPHGAAPMTVFQVRPNNRETFYKVIGEVDREYIIGAHGWSGRLIGRVLSGGLSDNTFIDDLKTRIPMLKNQRKTLVFDINRAFQEISNFMNPTLKEYGINYYSKLMTTVENMEDVKDSGSVVEKENKVVEKSDVETENE